MSFSVRIIIEGLITVLTHFVVDQIHFGLTALHTLLRLIHGCIITSLKELVKLFFEIFPILLVAGGVLFRVIPSREPCFKGTFEEFEELIVHACIIPDSAGDVNRVGKDISKKL